MDPALLLTLLAAIASLLYLLLLLKPKRTPAPFPPGAVGLPFLGSFLDVPSQHPWFYFDQLHKEFGPLIHLKVLGQHHVFIGDGELAQELLSRRSAIYSSRTNSHYFNKDIAPNGRHWVFSPDDAYWRLARKLTGPLMASVRAGKTESLQEMEATFTLVEVLRDPARWVDHLARFASSSVMAATYGKHCPQHDDPAILDIVELNDLVAAGANPSASPTNYLPSLDLLPSSFATPWRSHAARLREREDRLYYGLMEGADLKEVNFWATRLKRGKGEGEMGVEPAFLAGQLVNAAAETTFITLKSFMLAMSLYPSAISSARSQIDAIVGSERPPTFSDRSRLPLVDALLRETFRKWPSLPFGMDHTATKDDVVEVGGRAYFIPKGCVVHGSAWTIEKDPVRYPDPERFLPERHLDVNGALMKDDGTAFGWGRRDTFLFLGVSLFHRLLDADVPPSVSGRTLRGPRFVDKLCADDLGTRCLTVYGPHYWCYNADAKSSLDRRVPEPPPAVQMHHRV